MFPSEISTDLASLNDDTKRKTITTKIDLNNDFNTTHSEIFESIFHNKKRFTYSEFNKQFNNYSESFHKDLNLFHEIAK
jgi:exoribonuclease R